jgi:hypothetical protein
MLSPQVEAHIGLGLFLEGDGPSARFSHGGSNRGFRCQAVACRATGQGAVVMTNADGGDSLLPELIKVLEREYAWPPLPKK